MVVVAVLVPLAGCTGGDSSRERDTGAAFTEEPTEGLVIEHEVGSARNGEDRLVRDQIWRACGASGTTAGDLCRQHVHGATSDLPPLGETDPAFDITGATFAEDGTDLIVSLELARLHEDWSHVEPWDRTSPEARYYYNVGWVAGDDDEGIPVGLGFGVMNTYSVYYFDAFLYVTSEACNDWWLCATRVPVEFDYGEPGAIRWIVPRAIVPQSEKGDTLDVTELSITKITSTNARISWGLQDGPADESGSVQAGGGGYTIDRWRGEEGFTFRTPMEPFDRSALTTPAFDIEPYAPYDSTETYRGDIDMQEARLIETETTFAVEVEFAGVQAEPRDHMLWIAAGMPSGRIHQFGYDVIDGETEAYSGFDDPSRDLRWFDVPFDLEREAGQPGRVRFTMDRQDLGSPAKDERLSLLWLVTAAPGMQQADESVGPSDLLFREYTRGIGWAGDGSPPYWFEMDTAPPTDESLGLAIEDMTGDVELPTVLPNDDVSEDQFDITYVQTAGRDESTLQAILGIQDLAHVEVPVGYEAVVYAVGFQTDLGNFQAFYYKDSEQQGYYCSSDTLVLSDEASDPNGVVWTEIPGLLSHGGRGPDGASGSASGAITLDVPHECLGVEEGELFEVHEFAAGTYVLEDPADAAQIVQIHQVDQAQAGQADLPFLLGVEALPDDAASSPAWYAAPLGLEGQDWDVLGVSIALLLALGGTLAVYRRRQKLRRYLDRVGNIAKIHDLAAREKGLTELRTALQDDLTGGKISDGHYTAVLRHIDDAVKDGRVQSIEETFRELPFHVVSKLRSVLADGRITQSEREMVVDLVERAEIPAKYKDRVLSRLERWTLLDQGTPS